MIFHEAVDVTKPVEPCRHGGDPGEKLPVDQGKNLWNHCDRMTKAQLQEECCLMSEGVNRGIRNEHP
jgi:hypothetical protein